MAIQITRRDLEEAYKASSDILRRSRDYRGAGENAVGVFASQAESGLAAFGFGVLEGRYGPIKVGPLHADFVLAALGHAAGLFGVAGKHAGHVHNFSQGLMDGYLARVGMGVGAAWGLKATPVHTPTYPTTFGYAHGQVRHGVTGGAAQGRMRMGGPAPRPFTVAEVASMARGIR